MRDCRRKRNLFSSEKKFPNEYKNKSYWTAGVILMTHASVLVGLAAEAVL
jgi:hypothetical protein